MRFVLAMRKSCDIITHWAQIVVTISFQRLIHKPSVPAHDAIHSRIVLEVLVSREKSTIL